MKMKMKAVLTACMGATTTLLLIAVGCKVGPNYQNPNMPVPAQFWRDDHAADLSAGRGYHALVGGL